MITPWLYLAVNLAVGLVCAVETGALTIYRIGGESVLPPEPDSLNAPPESVQFVQLSWDELAERPNGRSHLVEIHPDSIRPDFVENRNLMPEVEDRGGLIRARSNGRGAYGYDKAMTVIYDRKPETAYRGQPPMARWASDITIAGAPYCVGEPNLCKYVWVSLTGAYPLQRISIYPSPGNEDRHFIPTYTLGISDGDPLKAGTRERSIADESDLPVDFLADFDLVAEVLENKEPLLEFEFLDEPVQEILFIAPVGDWEIAEFEIYADGFAVSSDYASGVIDLEQAATLGPFTWSGALHPGAHVDLRVRSGDTPDPHLYYRNTFRGAERSRYNAEGSPLDRSTYFNLETGEQAGIAPDVENWSPWSSPLKFSAQAADFATPRPRRYLQFKADFHSGGRLDYLQFPVTQPPVATRAVAEIEPARVHAGQTSRFRYLLLPEIRVGDQGFDRIEIAAPSRIDRVESVAIDGVPLEASQWQATIDSGAFVVHIPRRDERDTRDLIEIVFHARIFDYGTVFDGRLYDSTRPWEVAQDLEPGDAAFLADSNSLTVELIEVGQQVLDAIELSAEAFTPNGDGVNDQLDIRFDLVNLSAPVPVNLEVFDLAGTRRAQRPLAQRGSGPHSVSWDGRDDNRGILPPGLYVLRLDVDTDNDTFTASRVVSLAY